MKKMCVMLLALISLSVLSFSAHAGYWQVRCYRPCHHCHKTCYRVWVRNGYYRNYGYGYYGRHHHGYRGYYGYHGHGHHGHRH